MSIKLTLTMPFLKNYFLYFFALCYICVNAQNNFSGNIFDSSNGEILVGANIMIGDSIGQSTDSVGHFSFNLPPGDYNVSISFIGYQTLQENITLDPGKNLEKNFILELNNEMLDLIVVTDSRYEQRIEEATTSLDVIPASVINRKVSANIQKTISQLPSVHIVEGQVNIRGGNGWAYGVGSRVMMLQDGIPMMMGSTGSIQWEMIPAEGVAQIEVMKGASSVLYGSSALNGTINIITKKPEIDPKTTITYYRGIYDDPKRKELIWDNSKIPQTFQSTSIYHARKIKNWDLTVNYNFFEEEFYIQGLENKRNRLSVFTSHQPEKKPGLQIGLAANLMHNQKGFSFLYDGNDNGYSPFNNIPYIFKTDEISLSPTISYQKPGSDIKQSLKSQYLRVNYIDTVDNFSNNYYLDYQIQKRKADKYAITLGTSVNYIEGRSEAYQVSAHSINNSVYGQGNFDFNKFHVSTGLRYERYYLNGVSYDNLVKRIGLNYEVSNSLSLRASYSEAFRFPSMFELYFERDAGEITFLPNSELKPESGWNAEIGALAHIKKGNFNVYADIAAFVMRFDDMMELSFGVWGDSTRLNPLGIGFKSINVGETEIAGAEFGLYGDGKIGRLGFDFHIGYTYMHPIALNRDEVYASYTDKASTIVPPEYLSVLLPSLQAIGEVSYNSTSSNPGILKYRYQHLAKMDLDFHYKWFHPGINVRYNSFMENIDLIFESYPFNAEVEDIFSVIHTVTPETNVQIQDMHIKSSREKLKDGDLFVDLRFGFDLNTEVYLQLGVENLFNREFQPRPGALGPPRQFTFQTTIKL
jgi:iron complex outermembrane receptor protein